MQKTHTSVILPKRDKKIKQELPTVSDNLISLILKGKQKTPKELLC